MWTFVSMCPLNLIPFYYFQDYVKSVIFCFRGPLSSACKCFLQSPIFEILCWLYLFPLLPYFCSPTNLTFSQNSCLEWLTSLPHPHLPLKRVLLKSFLSSYSKANECFFHCHLNLSEAFNSKTTPSFLENSPVLASIESYSQVSPCLPDPSVSGKKLGLLLQVWSPFTRAFKKLLCTYNCHLYISIHSLSSELQGYIDTTFLTSLLYSLRGSSNSTLSCMHALPPSACPLHAPES